MSDWREGDLVEGSKGESKAVGRLVYSTVSGCQDRLFLENFPFIPYVDADVSQWKFTLIETAPKPLPTEPGHYLIDFPKLGHVYTLDSDGRWWDGSVTIGTAAMESILRSAGRPLQRLEPTS